jgi:hypothetical protein
MHFTEVYGDVTRSHGLTDTVLTLPVAITNRFLKAN